MLGSEETRTIGLILLFVSRIGAGIAGIYQLYRLRALGLSVRVFETGGGVARSNTTTRFTSVPVLARYFCISSMSMT